jgi:hypothetical protein
MRIKNLLTGAVSNVRGDIARAMIDQHMAEAVTDGKEGRVVAPVFRDGKLLEEPYEIPQPGAALPLDWHVVTISGVGKPYAAIQLTIGHPVLKQSKKNVQEKAGQSTLLWAGDPKAANAKRTWPGGFRHLNGLGREIPEDILKQYADFIRRNPALLHDSIPGEALAGLASQFDPRYPRNEKIAQDKKLADEVIRERQAGLKEVGAI